MMEKLLNKTADYPEHPDQLVVKKNEFFPNGVCLDGNTKIPCLNGQIFTLKELAENHCKEKIWVYSFDGKNIVPGLAHSFRKTKKCETIKIVLDNNEEIVCTLDHKIMLRDGSYRLAKDLKQNESLMPLYRNYGYYGYETLFQPVKNKWQLTHYAVLEFFKGNFFEQKKKNNLVVHHKNFNKLDNTPENLQLMSNKDHLELHYGSDEWRELQSQRAIQRWKNPEIRKKYLNTLEKNWHNLALNKEASERLKEFNQTRTFEDRRKSALKRWEKRKKQIKVKCSNCNKKIIRLSTQTNKNFFCSRECHYKFGNSIETRQKISKSVIRHNEIKKIKVINHKVKEIIFWNKYLDVYDMTVDSYNNFAISQGVFVHNCEIDVWNYYDGVKNKLVPEFKGRDLFVVMAIKPGTRLYLRHPYDKKTEYIRINSVEEFEKYHTGKTGEYHVTSPTLTDEAVFDVDPGPGATFESVKNIVSKCLDFVKKQKDFKSNPEVRFTGKRSFHIDGKLKSKRKIDEIRKDVEKRLEEFFKDDEIIVVATNKPSGKKINVDLSPMKSDGGHVAPYSMRIETGLCCVPVTSLNSFKKEDAKLDKVYQKVTGKKFKWDNKKQSYLQVLQEINKTGGRIC